MRTSLKRGVRQSPFIATKGQRKRNDFTRAKKFDREFFLEENYSYDTWHRDRARAIVTCMFQNFRPKKDWVFLDIGCALGGIVEVLRRRGFESYGIDVSSFCLEHSPVKQYMRWGTVTSIPAKDQSVDISLCIDTFQYLTREEAKSAAQELRRVTRRYLCFETIAKEDKYSDQNFNPDALRKNRSLLTASEYIKLFKTAGFTLKKRHFLPRSIEGQQLGDDWYEYDFSFNAIFEVVH